MTIEKRVERLEHAAQIAEQPLKHILLRFDRQTDGEAIDCHGRGRLGSGVPIEFIHIVGVAPTHCTEEMP